MRPVRPNRLVCSYTRFLRKARHILALASKPVHLIVLRQKRVVVILILKVMFAEASSHHNQAPLKLNSSRNPKLVLPFGAHFLPHNLNADIDLSFIGDQCERPLPFVTKTILVYHLWHLTIMVLKKDQTGGFLERTSTFARTIQLILRSLPRILIVQSVSRKSQP